jgi:hypothetical protein
VSRFGARLGAAENGRRMPFLVPRLETLAMFAVIVG